jgi:hypothetical protein
MSTDTKRAFERIATLEDVGYKLQAERNAMQAQRDELLAALERIATYDGGAGRIARDAIAKVQS